MGGGATRCFSPAKDARIAQDAPTNMQHPCEKPTYLINETNRPQAGNQAEHADSQIVAVPSVVYLRYCMPFYRTLHISFYMATPHLSVRATDRAVSKPWLLNISCRGVVHGKEAYKNARIQHYGNCKLLIQRQLTSWSTSSNPGRRSRTQKWAPEARPNLVYDRSIYIFKGFSSQLSTFIQHRK